MQCLSNTATNNCTIYYFIILTIICRQFYFPRDFSSFTLTAVYIHPRADTNAAVKDPHNTISMCENDHPSTLSIVAGDLNQASITLAPVYKQKSKRCKP